MWGGFALLTMDNGEPPAVRSAMRRFQDATAGSDRAVLRAMHTLPRRRAGSKPSERVGDVVHEESRPAK